ncbi:hypothetical protein GMOD_00010088 [Pyrenophora seminiperda CCB06]|uniref:Uncharacterized protein n=1 Tax=Pyrenophora seminiperda CCB06 TaxID=1302712 RepID=A0A3M7LZT0_9PLEO|nr:hypothetical protein GMOD_00010088 [Pyrenophora seminiperda CCB06]
MRGAAACSKLAYPCLHYGELGSLLRIRWLESMASSRAAAAQFMSCVEPTDPSKCLRSGSSPIAVSLACSAGRPQQPYDPGSATSAPQSLLSAIASIPLAVSIAGEHRRRKLQSLSKIAYASALPS